MVKKYTSKSGEIVKAPQSNSTVRTKKKNAFPKQEIPMYLGTYLTC